MQRAIFLMMIFFFYAVCPPSFAKAIFCVYANEKYYLGQVIFLENYASPFYCTIVNGKPVWRNVKRLAGYSALNFEMDNDGVIYPVLE